jgi:hypothetical protein
MLNAGVHIETYTQGSSNGLEYWTLLFLFTLMDSPALKITISLFITSFFFLSRLGYIRQIIDFEQVRSNQVGNT